MSTPKPPSPAAQALRVAFWGHLWGHPGNWDASLGAALRAAAPMMQFAQDHEKLLDIAAELEGSNA